MEDRIVDRVLSRLDQRLSSVAGGSTINCVGVETEVWETSLALQNSQHTGDRDEPRPSGHCGHGDERRKRSGMLNRPQNNNEEYRGRTRRQRSRSGARRIRTQKQRRPDSPRRRWVATRSATRTRQDTPMKTQKPFRKLDIEMD